MLMAASWRHIDSKKKFAALPFAAAHTTLMLSPRHRTRCECRAVSRATRRTAQVSVAPSKTWLAFGRRRQRRAAATLQVEDAKASADTSLK